MEYTYNTKGVCSRKIFLELDGNRIVNVKFEGGCDGNTKGVVAMVRGLTVDEVVSKLKGIQCGRKGTSCPDQLTIALEQALDQEKCKKN